MKKLKKLIRILTLPPIIAGLTVLLLYWPCGLLTAGELLVSELCLAVAPALAYPLGAILAGKDGDCRNTQRKLAFVFSVLGYAVGFVYSLLPGHGQAVKVVFLSYMLSVVILAALNWVFHFKASGHACSSSAPLVLLGWYLSPWALLPCALLIWAVYDASFKLKQHTLPQLLTGSAISVASSLLAIAIY